MLQRNWIKCQLHTNGTSTIRITNTNTKKTIKQATITTAVTIKSFILIVIVIVRTIYNSSKQAQAYGI